MVSAGCGERASTASNANEQPPAAKPADQGEKNVVLDAAMMETVKVETVQEKSLPRLLTATGKVQFNEDLQARILAPVGGQVQQLRVKVGDPIRKGDILFMIHSRDVAAALDEYLDSRKDLDLAEKTANMQRDLFAHQAASLIALQQAESEFAKAKARATRTAESLRALGVDVRDKTPAEDIAAYVAVRTPRNGTVIERTVTEGQFVQPDNTALITIADLSSVWVLADIFERDLHAVSVGQKAEVTTSAYPDQRFVAHVAHINEVVDPATRTVKVRFLVDNAAGRLKPEMFASASIFLHEAERVLTLPTSAVFTEGGRSFVYRQTAERSFIRHPVEVEAGASELKVLNGLQTGDHVVSDGALLMRLEETRQAMN
jgi:cobalt-zinc-cadmium efflux system membrane fusion protein